MNRTWDAELFDGKCPYTEKPCYEWECNSCEVNAQEKKDMEELDKAESVVGEIYFEVKDDVVIKHTSMHEIEGGTYKAEIVMTKEIFQECYKKWVEPQESEDICG